MKITRVKFLNLHPTDRNILAYCDVSLDNCLMIHSVKVIEAGGRRFIGMPHFSRNGEYHDVVNPITREFRDELTTVVLSAYDKAIRVRVG